MKIKIKHRNIELWTEFFGVAKAPVILLIAGAHAPATFWPSFFCKALVAHGYFVIRYDHRDIGYSTHFQATNDIHQPIYTIKDLAEDAIAILDHYNIQKAHIMGHSMGGFITQYMAAFQSDRLLNATSISANIKTQMHQNPKHGKIMQALLKNKPIGNVESDWPGWLNSWKILQGNTYAFDETMAKRYTRDIYTRHEGDFKPAWNHIAATLTKPSLIDKLPNDLVLIHGSADVLQPVDEIEALKNKFNVHIIPGAGHVFFNRHLWQIILQIFLHSV
jgi:pimeloyl-ACP methyl ester carboxylesterase